MAVKGVLFLIILLHTMSYSLVPPGEQESSNFSRSETGPLRRTSSTPLVVESPTLAAIDGLKTPHHNRYLYSIIALVVALITFVVQTECTGYLATSLDYHKPFLMLYLTHSSWSLLWPMQIMFLRIRKRNIPFRTFLSRHVESVYKTARVVQAHSFFLGPMDCSTPKYIIASCAILAVALNFAGSSWYVAVNMTTPGDLTAIYNCSAFFAYAFSVFILNEAFNWHKTGSVILSIVGVLIVAYSGGTDVDNADLFPNRATGNLIIGVGAVLYGLYEVLYKKVACPPNDSVSPRREAAFANVIGSVIGLLTFLLLWPIIPIMHWTGIETFVAPTGEILIVLLTSVLANCIFSGSFLVLMALTSPVLSSVAALLTTFLVAIVDWLLFGTVITFGGLIGSLVIVLAFGLLSYASWQELQDDGFDEDVSVA